MIRRPTFASLLAAITLAGTLAAQTPPRMALPTGGLTPPKLITPQPVLVAAQPKIAITSTAKPAVLPTQGAPLVLPLNGVGTGTAAAPTTKTTPALPEWRIVQKPELPPASRYDRATMYQPESRDPNRIRDCVLKASAEVQLPAQEAGVLVELLAAEGLKVTVNQPLGRIDDAQPRLQKKAAQAERAVTFEKGKSTINERYALKASDVSKQKWLKGVESNQTAPGSVSQIEILENKLLYEKALLEYERAQDDRKIEELTVLAKDVDVEAADDAIRRRQLISPIAGTIVELTPHVGEWLKPGDPVLKIVNLEVLKIEGYVNIDHYRQDQVRNRTVIAEVDLGNKIVVRVPAKIAFVSPVVEPGGEYRIKAEIQNRKNAQTGEWELQPGLNAELVLNDVAKNP